MSRCHNCGREALRTEDWACQWCGYPLVSGSYKKIEKTYRQLKEESLLKIEKEPVLEIKLEPEIETEEEVEKIQVLEPEEETEKEKEPIQKPEPELGIEQKIKPEEGVLDESEDKAGTEPVSALEIEQEAEAVPESEPETQPEVKQEIETEEDAAGETESKDMVEAEGSADIAVESEEVKKEEVEVAPEIKVEPEPETKPGPELETAAEELNVSELFKAYEADDVAADERFADKILKITGVLSLVDVKNVSDRHYIRLAASEGDLMQSVQCMFDKKHASVLSKLEKGQLVTVQGRYNGSVIAMRIVDCVLIP